MIKTLLSLRRVTTSPELVCKELPTGRQDTNYISIVFSQHVHGQSQCSKLWAFPVFVSIYLPAPALHNTFSNACNTIVQNMGNGCLPVRFRVWVQGAYGLVKAYGVMAINF